MKYTNFKGDNVSLLGFGCMRFSSLADSGDIDEELVSRMFDRAIDAGINYFDTAYPYLSCRSEGVMARALKKYPRDSYYIADKFPGHSLPGPIDNKALFNISLQRCNTDYFDFYLLHNVTDSTIKIYESDEYHIIPDIIRLKEEGKIRHLGFSSHGGPELIDYMLTKYEGLFEFVQIQYNYIDASLQNADEKIKIIKKHGAGVWVMEPCRGGKLSSLEGKNLEKLQTLNKDSAPSSYAFRYLFDKDVDIILSGMNSMSQVEDNIRTFEEFRLLSNEEKKALDEISADLVRGVPCTSCRYCTDGCPVGLDIPVLLGYYNDMSFSSSFAPTMRIDALDENKKPGACISCRRCAEICPQKIDIPSVMSKLSEMYKKAPKWADAAKARHEAIKKDLNMK